MSVTTIEQPACFVKTFKQFTEYTLYMLLLIWQGNLLYMYMYVSSYNQGTISIQTQ